ncbi:MAG: helix-turn-helix domain-containing protein [Acidimicrobiales bacterium]
MGCPRPSVATAPKLIGGTLKFATIHADVIGVWSISADLIPPVRLGRLLRERREELGWTLPELSALHGLDTADLDAMEAGVRLLDPATMELIDAVYGVEHGSIVPRRTELVIDVDEGTIAAAEQTVGLGDTDRDDQVLTRYLALVYALRGLPLGSPITFRDVDLSVLGRALTDDVDVVHHRLKNLVDDYRPELRDTSRLFRKATVVPIAGLLVGLTAVGGLVLVQREADSMAESTPVPSDQVGLMLPLSDSEAATEGVIVGTGSTTPAVLGMNDAVEIGDAAVLERPSAAERAANEDAGIDIDAATRIERPADED